MLKEDTAAIVMDIGSSVSKVGFAGEESPYSVFPTIVGRPRESLAFVAGPGKTTGFVGHDANIKRGILNLRKPVQRGSIKDWEDIETLWTYIFESVLQVNSNEHPVLITEVPLNPTKCREKTFEMMFEKYETPGLFIVMQPVVSLYAHGLNTGMVLESGDGITHLVPIYEGYAIDHHIKRLDMGGCDLTDYLDSYLKQKGYEFSKKTGLEVIQDIKERYSFVLTDNEQITNTDITEKYELPDGQVIELKEERYLCPEVLLQPGMVNLDSDGIHKLLHQSIQRCDIHLRKTFYQHIILSGGNTMFQGLSERLEREINHLVPTSAKVKISSSHDSPYSAWVGGSIIASLNSFLPMWITLADFKEVGPSIVHRN